MVNPVMLVVAKDIADADEYGIHPAVDGVLWRRLADTVLVVHSNAPDEALEALSEGRGPGHRRFASSSRSGCSKKAGTSENVYVIASMRSSVSEILTEQTLGRGMRLPFGAYTDIEILDTLEVVAHERYEELLKKAGVLNESFIDQRPAPFSDETPLARLSLYARRRSQRAHHRK